MSDNPPIPLRPETPGVDPAGASGPEAMKREQGQQQQPEHPELPRARTAARIVGLYIPLGLVVVQLIVFLAWLPRLPDEVAVHWSGAGVPDGFASPIVPLLMFPLGGLVMASLFFLTKVMDLQAKASPKRAGDAWGPMNRLVPAIVLSGSVLIFMLGIFTTWMQLDLADGRDLEPNAWVSILPTLVGTVAGGLGYLAQPKLRVSAAVDADAGAPLELAGSERVAWLGVIGVTKPYLWTMVIALVVVVASFIFVLSLRPMNTVIIVVNGVLLALVLVLTVVGVRFNVRIDERGFEARSFTGWPVLRARATNIADVSVGEINPFDEFGGWGLRLSVDGKIGVVMRTGEGLRIERRRGRPLVITLDDADAAASALATAAKHAQAEPPPAAAPTGGDT